ncbi:hypothetical protein BDL97_11G016700 [Sphagnum fallax]|jgi:uncharacterized membrane protein (UPF0136 family)|nr:hypothetical protein BDL97_11G016700 [Sphagnum fallax]
MCAATSVVVDPMSSSSSAVCGSCDVVRALSRTTTEVRSRGGLKYPQQSLFNGPSAAGSGAFSGKPAAELRSSFRGERVAVVKVVSSGSSSRTAKKKNKDHSCGSITAELSLVEYAPLTAAVYGAAILGGGLFAYTRSGSKYSLGGGLLGGASLGVAYLLMQTPETRELGEAVGFGVGVLLATLFAIRLVSTGKLIPAVPLLGLSTAASLVFAVSYLQTRVPLP